ncbi:hypothetical protein PILCRDRAFT_236435 [Piloderma croceum F 1598]|uniref:Uncharacterized protein n=1 Tax=Piloderma croceum (strain F 1598) TaxID=765440 RepID=A0A0C3CG42_PILCF|nr:hypothetical protein PILCRDRAFT_236435 [Piloderma croceum F 1598]
MAAAVVSPAAISLSVVPVVPMLQYSALIPNKTQLSGLGIKSFLSIIPHDPKLNSKIVDENDPPGSIRTRRHVFCIRKTDRHLVPLYLVRSMKTTEIETKSNPRSIYRDQDLHEEFANVSNAAQDWTFTSRQCLLVKQPNIPNTAVAIIFPSHSTTLFPL